MKTSSSSSSGSSSSTSSSYHSLPQTERKKIAISTEQRLYELACKARAKGMFVKIPPSHKRARTVAEEMIKVLNYEKHTCVKPLADLTDAHQAIKDLSFVKTEKLNQRPGYNHIMTVLKEEFQNYTTLALQRGLDEKGELFQLIAHYPKIGLILQRVNVDRPFRYDGIIDELSECEHATKKEVIGSLIANKLRTRITVPAVKNCVPCEKQVVDAANEKLDIMHRRLEEKSSDFTVDATLHPHSFEKCFKMSRNLVEGTASQDYATAIDSLRKIWGYDITSIEKRETMFKDRVRQQKLIAMFNIYNDKEIGEELDEVVKNIDTIAKEIQEIDAKTLDELQKLKEAFSGNWEKVRKCLGTKSPLSSDERTIRKLQDKVEEYEKDNSKLRNLLEKEKAKNRAEEKKDAGKYAKKEKKDHEKGTDEDRRKYKSKEKDEPSSSSSSIAAKRMR